MLLTLNKLNLFNTGKSNKKEENQNAFLNDLKKKMDTNKLDLEANEGQDIEEILSEDISS